MQKPDAYFVTIIRPPERELTVGDVIIGSLGMAGTLMVLSLLLGVVAGTILVVWHRLWPTPWRPMPPVSPLIPGAEAPPSSQPR